MSKVEEVGFILLFGLAIINFYTNNKVFIDSFIKSKFSKRNQELLMLSIRYDTFETNSSSCHSFTMMNKSDWEQFKKNNLFINANTFSSLDIHTTVFDDTTSDYQKPILAKEYYERVVEEVKETLDKHYERYYNRNYGNPKLLVEVDNYLRNNISVDLVKKVLLGDSNEIIAPLKEKIIEDYSIYYSDNKDHIFTRTDITIGDLYDRLFGDESDIFEYSGVYIYGHNDWNPKNVKIKEYTSPDNPDKILLEREIQD